RAFLETQQLPDNDALAYKIDSARLMVDRGRGSPFHDGVPIDNDLYPIRRKASERYGVEGVRDACHAMRVRILELFGETVAAAYVPPNAPALRDPVLKEAYE